MSSSATSHAGHPSLLAELTGVRVLVISDEPVIRAGVRCLLASRSQTLAFVEDRNGHAADVVFYDVLGLRCSGGQDLRAVVRSHPGRVVALARTLQPGLTARALQLGAIAAVPLSAQPDELLAAVHGLLEGRFQDGSCADVANRRDRDARLGLEVCLSPREHQILSLIVAGESNQEIAAEMNISANTVKSLIRAAYLKIGVTRRAQAVAWGVDHGIPTQVSDA